MIYQAIVGSRAHGIETAASDVDVVTFGGEFLRYEAGFQNGRNDFSYPSRVLSAWTAGDGPAPWYAMQCLFPEKILTDNELSRFIAEHREALVSAQLPGLYRVLWDRAEGLGQDADWLYASCPKRMTYSTLLYSTLANYAEGMPFAQAHRPEGELHDFLVGMRLREVPLEEALARNERERIRAKKVSSFFQKSISPEILKDFEQVAAEEAGKENGQGR